MMLQVDLGIRHQVVAAEVELTDRNHHQEVITAV
jgi:hypothetical protein